MISNILHTNHSRISCYKLILISMLIFPRLVMALDVSSSGRIESRVGVLANESDDGTRLVHMERVNWGIRQELSMMGLQYSLSGGGLLRGSTLLDSTEFIPEFQVKAQMKPIDVD